MGQKRQCNSNIILLFFYFPPKKSRLYLKKDLSTSKRVFKTIEILKGKKNHHKIPEKSIIHSSSHSFKNRPAKTQLVGASLSYWSGSSEQSHHFLLLWFGGESLGGDGLRSKKKKEKENTFFLTENATVSQRLAAV